MRCPACDAHNPPTATACSSCKGALKPRRVRRRHRDSVETSPKTEEYNRQVEGIFKVCLASVVPFVGLVLGPVGAVRAWRLLRRGRDDPNFQADRAARAALLLGGITGVTNWLGLALMAAGLLQL